ncbi:TapB family protein [Mucilaginibacter sp.]
MQKNKTIEMTAFNNKRDVTFKTVTKVSDVTTENGVTTANVLAEGYDKNGKLINSSNVAYKCNGGVMMMDMSFNAPQQSQQQTSRDTKMTFKVINQGYMEYPSGMHVGDHLKDATSQIEMTMGNGMTGVTTVQITDRMIVGKETVTTPAGSWDCLKITYKTTSSTTFKGAHADTINSAMSTLDKLRSKLGKFGPKTHSNTSENTVWYAPGFGMVKIQGKTFVMELTGIK